MSLKKYLFLMFLATILCWAAFAFVLFFMNPKEAGAIGFSFFYLSLFLGLFGVFSLVGFLVRYVGDRNNFAYRQVRISFRQGALFAFLLTGSLFLQSYRLLVWWNTLLFVFLLSVVEYYFLANEQKHPE